MRTPIVVDVLRNYNTEGMSDEQIELLYSMVMRSLRLNEELDLVEEVEEVEELDPYFEKYGHLG